MTTRLTVSSLALPQKISVNTTFSKPLDSAGPFFVQPGLTSKNVLATVNLKSIGDAAAAKTTLILPNASSDYIFKTASGAVTISETTTNPTTQKSTTKVIASLDLTKTGVTPLVKFTDLTAKFQPTSIKAHTLAASELLTTASPTFTLNDTGASTTDGITNNGALNAVSAGNTVEYSIDGGKNYTAGSTLPEGVYEAGSAKLRATSSNGGVSKVVSIDKKMVIDKTAPAVPVIKLDSDTGISPTDGITKNGSITVSGIEAGAKVAYSLDAGKTFTTLTGSSFVAPEGVYAKDQIVVKQTDVAGNVSATATLGNLTVDTTVAIPNIALAVDTGISPTDGITNNKLVNVTGLESGAIWQYSVNASPFENGTGTTFNLPADLVYEGGADADILVRQTDIAGNESDDDGKYGSNSTTWTLDTVKPSQLALSGFAINDTGISGDYVTSNAKVTISNLDAGATLYYNVDGSTTFTAATGNSFVIPNGSYAAGKIQWQQMDVAGNFSPATAFIQSKIIANDIVNVTGTNATALDAGTANKEFVITAGTYTYNIANFGADDRIDFPAGSSVSIVNASFTDGSADIQGVSAADGTVTTIHLTNLKPEQDAVLKTSAASFNAIFGDKSINTDGNTANTSFIHHPVSATGTASAAAGDNIFDFAAGTYKYNVTSFADGDKLNFPVGDAATVKNVDFADGKVDVEWADAATGSLVVVTVDVTPAIDAGIRGATTFKAQFGADSITNNGAPKPTPATGDTLTVSAADNGKVVSASNGALTFNLTSGNYNYTISDFAKGDVLDFPDVDHVQVKNVNFTDNSVVVEWASNGNVIHVELTGITSDASIIGPLSFNNVFGSGSII